MSNLRHSEERLLARSYGLTFSHRTLRPPTSEAWDQLVFAARGVLTVKTDVGTWVVPPYRAVWLPANTVYTLEMSGPTALRMIYLPRTQVEKSGQRFDRRQCVVVSVSPLLRELIIRTNQIGALTSESAVHRHLAGLIESELEAVATLPLQLPYPKSLVASKYALLIDGGVGNLVDMSSSFAACGASRRTMERLFKAETGMSLGQWIRQRKLLWGLQNLLAGEAIGEIAFRLGYSTPSAFIAMFKRELGKTPGEYAAGP